MKSYKLAGKIGGKGFQQGALLNYLRLFSAYKQRVTADSGLIAADVQTKQLFKLLEPTFDSIEFAWSGVAGSKLRTDGIYDYYTKLYDMSANGDATQTTEVNQPYQSGKIAPNEFSALHNPNGDVKYVTHPEISFAANEAWTVTTVLNWNSSNDGDFHPWANRAINASTWLSIIADGGLSFRNDDGALTGSVDKPLKDKVGKKAVVHFIANGDGTLNFYVNNVGSPQRSIATNISFGFLGSVSNAIGRSFFGELFYHTIRRQALTPEQILAEAQLLQTIYPEVPSVTIGSDIVATSNTQVVASSDGTVITEAADNSDWATGLSRWRYYNQDSQIGSWAGKLYNKAAKLVLVANPPSSWHYATEAELTAIATNGGNALKKEGADYWNTTGGTNATGFTALGTGMCNTDGTFQDLKNTSTFWCADSDKVLKLNHNDNTATIVAAAANEGHALRLVKD